MNFFKNVYPNFDVYDQAKIIVEFQKDAIGFIQYLNKSQEKKLILEQLNSGIIQFVEEKDLEKSLELLPILLAYINLEEPPFNDELISKAFEKINSSFEKNIMVKINTIEEILKYYTKIIAYTSYDKKIYNKLLQSKNFKEYEKIICNYIEKMQKETMIDNELINLLVETEPSISSSNIKSSLKKKFNEKIDLSKYDDFVNNMLPIDKNINIFFDDIKKYRIQNNIIPENICIYVNKFYNSEKEILRLCNIDYMRHYLNKNNIKNISVFYDNLMEFGARGLASPTCLSLKVTDLNIVMFHEATHVIQYNNQGKNENYIKYYYSMLKDSILHQKLDLLIYNRNHNRYLFEIDADIQGEREYYNFLEKLGLLNEEDKEKRDKLEEKEIFRISLSNRLNIDGYNYDKGEIFDSILPENLDLLDAYPILQIEYNRDGYRKNMLEILKSLEHETNSNKRSEEEIISIAGCIFGESYVVDDVPGLLDQLKSFTPTTKVILQIEKGLIQELEMYNNQSELDKKEETNNNGTRKKG